jgi:hypothetical protein
MSETKLAGDLQRLGAAKPLERFNHECYIAPADRFA